MPSYTISDNAAITMIEKILATFPLGDDEPISGYDAVDALIEIQAVIKATQFLPRGRA